MKFCTGCLYMVKIPWGKGDRIAYRCMSEEQGHYGRIVDTQPKEAIPMLYRPAWCKDLEMKENAKKLGMMLKDMNLPYGNIRECARQLFDIAKENEDLCKIVIEDIQAGKGIKDCEKELDKFARTHGGINSYDAEVIIRKFYGLPDAAPKTDDFFGTEEQTQKEETTEKQESIAFDLSAFL